MEFEWKETVRKWRITRGFEVAWMDDKAENHNGRPEHMGHPERLIGNEIL
jgi:hypothetical protein